MAQTTQQEQISPELYQTTLERLHLYAVSLEDMRACCDPEVAQDGQVEIDLTTESESRQSETEFLVFITYRLRGIREQESLLEIDAKYRIVFTTAIPVPKGFFEVYRDLNLSLTTMPYFRELVTSITGRMEIPTLTLPYQIYAAPQQELESQKTEKDTDEMPSRRERKPRNKKGSANEE